MKKRRKATRTAPVLSPSARPALLSPKRQAIIRPAFERPREFVLLSVRDLALRLGTDPATTVRIVRGMQFASHREFQHYVHELSIAHATSLDIMRTRQTVEGLRQARANGTQCIGITDTLVSPIGQFAHESFLTSGETPSFGSSYVSPMALFNVIVVACANHRRGRTLSLMKRVEQEQRHGFHWYES